MTKFRIYLFLFLIFMLYSKSYGKIREEKFNEKFIPISLRVYNKINYYAEEYDIPLIYAMGVANVETGLEGPFDNDYDPFLRSYAGALGPMQIMPSTARLYYKNISNNRIMYDIDTNVHISMRLLRDLKDGCGDWKKVFGAYNTGNYIVNDYSNRVYNYKFLFR